MSRTTTNGSTLPPSAPRETPRRPASKLRCVHRWIEAQAARQPDAVALTAAGVSIDYAALNARANRLARRLRTLGVGPEALVGLCVPRSIEMVVGLLAVLKAGGAYVPLDPSYPDDRLSFMLSDAGVSVLLTRSDLLDRIGNASPEVVALDRDEEWIAEADDRDLTGGASLDHLAYVIYTSGSTGRPKGVMIHHHGLSNYVAWSSRAYAIAQGQGAPLHSSIAFDLTVTALLAPLAAGRRVDLLDEGLGVEQLGEALRHASDYSLVKITPAHLRALGDQLAPEEAAGRTRAFIIGGEQLTSEHVEFWRTHAPETELINEYGPTEAVVGCCVYRVPRGEPVSGAIPVGRPIAGARLYVLDRHLEPVPVGASGELYIGGVGVARGYLGRPGLTAERFLPDPHSGESGARIYRTGDLARWRSDGQLEYLGRVDHQVKIRGYRVELGEIEAALASHPSLASAAVLAREYGPDDRRLVAYVVAAAGVADVDTSTLRAWLSERLPDYMVPPAFVVLDALPLTPNGKVDREALPDPGRDAGRSEDPSAFVPPRGPIEEAVAEVWGDLLGAGNVGAHDNFFDRGGHSLLALQLLSRARQVFDVEVPLKDFIEQATLANLGRLIERALADGGTPLPPIVRVDRSQPLATSFAQQRLWFLDRLQPGSPAYNIPIAVRLEGALDVDALRRALAEVIRRHEILRTTFDDDGGIPRQVIAGSVDLPLPVEDMPGVSEDRAMERVHEEATRPFDLKYGPLLRGGLIRRSEDVHLVWIVMHHIISDAWSLGVLVREVSALYDAFRRGASSPLPEPAIQYADFAAWQRNWLSGDVLRDELDFWKDRLTGLAPLEMPTDRPRPAAPTGRGNERYALISRELLDVVRALGREEGSTLYMTMLAAFQVLLHRYSGQEDIAVGCPVAGRSRAETEDLIGFFINTLVLRGDLSGAPSFRELLRRIRRTAIDAFAHQDLPFERLVTELHPERASGRSPLFQVMFSLQNTPLPSLRSPDLTLTPLESPSGTAKFDLTLVAAEWPEGLTLTMEYSSDLFDPATVDRMLAHLGILLEGIVAQPDRPIAALPMLTEEERRQVLGGWGGDPEDDWDADGLDELPAGLDELESEDSNFDAVPGADERLMET